MSGDHACERLCICECADTRYAGMSGGKAESLVTKRTFSEEHWFWSPGRQDQHSPSVFVRVQLLPKENLGERIKLSDVSQIWGLVKS